MCIKKRETKMPYWVKYPTNRTNLPNKEKPTQLAIMDFGD